MIKPKANHTTKEELVQTSIENVEKKKVWDFREQLKKGAIGEELFLNNYPRTLDLHPDHNGDFVVRKTGQKLELKTDSYDMEKTPNFFFERYSDFAKKTPGSVWQAQEHGCELFCYMFVTNRTVFEFSNLPELSKRIEELYGQKGFVLIQNKGWRTAGWIINRSKLADFWKKWTF